MEASDVSFISLPELVLRTITEFLDFQSLGRLACTCRKMRDIINCDSVWKPHSLQMLGTNLKSPVMVRR